MAALTGAALKSTTAEGLALESLMQLQAIERTAARNPDNRNFVTGTYNSDTGIYSGTFSFPVNQAIDATSGNLTLEAAEYLT